MTLLLEEYFRLGDKIQVGEETLIVKKLSRAGTDSLFLNERTGAIESLDLSLVFLNYKNIDITKPSEYENEIPKICT